MVTPIVVLLVLGSAALHPIRDLSLRPLGNAESAYFGVAVTWVIIAGMQCVLFGSGVGIDGSAVWLVVGSALSLSLYYWGTLTALRTGEVSIFYPIIRSSPLFIVAWSWAMLDHSYPVAVLAGVVITVSAGFFLHVSRHPSVSGIQGLALAAALVAAAAGAGYALVDAEAMKRVQPDVFMFWVYVMVSIALGILTVARGRSPQSLAAGFSQSPGRVALAGVSSYVSYYLILLAYQLDADPVVVTVGRQFSIPIMVGIAVWHLREKVTRRRALSAAALTLGIALTAAGD